MPKRRSLFHGLTPPLNTDPRNESSSVGGSKEQAAKKPRLEPDAPLPAPVDPTEQPVGSHSGRYPLTTRLRSDVAAALKRASLERRLAGQNPHMVQNILEEALEPWLKAHGYLK